jgi:hypothetical protein
MMADLIEPDVKQMPESNKVHVLEPPRAPRLGPAPNPVSFEDMEEFNLSDTELSDEEFTPWEMCMTVEESLAKPGKALLCSDSSRQSSKDIMSNGDKAFIVCGMPSRQISDCSTAFTDDFESFMRQISECSVDFGDEIESYRQSLDSSWDGGVITDAMMYETPSARENYNQLGRPLPVAASSENGSLSSQLSTCSPASTPRCNLFSLDSPSQSPAYPQPRNVSSPNTTAVASQKVASHDMAPFALQKRMGQSTEILDFLAVGDI